MSQPIKQPQQPEPSLRTRQVYGELLEALVAFKQRTAVPAKSKAAPAARNGKRSVSSLKA